MSNTKVSPIRAIMGFSAMIAAKLLVVANAVLKGLTGNTALANPVVPLTTFGNHITTYSNAVTAAEDGGKNAKATEASSKKVLVNDLRQLANYVESNCNDDLAIFISSGFTARAKPSASGPVAVPTFKSLDYGTHPGEILVAVKSVAGGKSYNVRYGPMPPLSAAAGSTPGSTLASTGPTAGAAPGAAPAAWTVLSMASTKKAIALDNLTSGTVYAFQVQALGIQGLSAWSDSSTIMCP